VVSYYLQFDTGGIIGITGLLLDVTEHKRVEAELRATAERSAPASTSCAQQPTTCPARWPTGTPRCRRFANRYSTGGRRAEQVIGAIVPDIVGQPVGAPALSRPRWRARQGFAGKQQWPSGDISYTWVNYIPDRRQCAVKGFFMLVSDVTALAELHLQELNEN
jgi:hypothetical protein